LNGGKLLEISPDFVNDPNSTSRVNGDRILSVDEWSAGKWNTVKNRNMQGNKHRTSTIFTTRGCCERCIYCESSRMGIIWGAIAVMYRSWLIPLVAHLVNNMAALFLSGTVVNSALEALNILDVMEAKFPTVFIYHRRMK